MYIIDILLSMQLIFEALSFPLLDNKSMYFSPSY